MGSISRRSSGSLHFNSLTQYVTISFRIDTSITVSDSPHQRPRILLLRLLTPLLNQRLMHIPHLIRIRKLSLLLRPFNILRVSLVLLLVHALKNQVSVFALVVTVGLLFVHVVVLELCFDVGFLADLLVAFVLHVAVLVLVDLFDVDRAMFGLYLHKLLVSVLYLGDDELHDHLLLQLLRERFLSFIDLDPFLELLLFFLELFLLLLPLNMFLLIELPQLLFPLMVQHLLILLLNLLNLLLLHFLLIQQLLEMPML